MLVYYALVLFFIILFMVLSFLLKKNPEWVTIFTYVLERDIEKYGKKLLAKELIKMHRLFIVLLLLGVFIMTILNLNGGFFAFSIVICLTISIVFFRLRLKNIDC